MAFRVLIIENEVDVKLKLENIIINKGDGDIWIPIDDISIIVLDNLKINFSVRLFSNLAEHNIGVIICNNEHLPIGFYSSYDNHSRISKMIGFQLNKDKNFYDNFWKLIVEKKIINQYSLLKCIKKNNNTIVTMQHYCNNLLPGDTTNREAHAAKVYFNELLGCSFSRGNSDLLINSGLDYGYTIIRAYIARVCVSYGLNSQLGIHHKNEYNRFNLVDDLIEPIRPFVDYYVYTILKDEKYFMPEHRHKIVNILNHKVLYNCKKMYISNMIEEYVSQYSSFLEGKRNNVIFPDFNGYIEEANGL